MATTRCPRSRRITTASAAAWIACGALTGCAGADEPAVTWVEELPVLEVTADARIGDFDDPTTEFSSIGGVDVGDDGNVYVLEASVPEIRVYAPDGTLLRRIGGRGGGPGEFEYPPRFGVVGDTVWALDGAATRTTLFDRRGAVLSTGRWEDVKVRLPSGSLHVQPRFMRSDGVFTSHAGLRSYPRPGQGGAPEPVDSLPVPVVVFAADGAVVDTIGSTERPPPRMWNPPSEVPPGPEFVDVGGRRVWLPSAPLTLPWWLPLEDGYVAVETPLAETGDDGVFTVARIGLDRDTVYHRALHYAPIPYTSEDLDSIAVWSARGEPGGMTPYNPDRGPPDDWKVIANHLRNAMRFPDFQLPIDYPWLARDGSVWLRRTAEGEPDLAEWIVLDPEGEPIGRVRLPADARIHWSRGDTLWVDDPDEFGVPWLVRYRLKAVATEAP